MMHDAYLHTHTEGADRRRMATAAAADCVSSSSSSSYNGRRKKQQQEEDDHVIDPRFLDERYLCVCMMMNVCCKKGVM